MQVVFPSAVPLVRQIVRDPRFKTRHFASPHLAWRTFVFLSPVFRNILRALSRPVSTRNQIDAQVEAFLREQTEQAAKAHSFDQRLDFIQHGLEQIFPRGPFAYVPLLAAGFLPLFLIRRLAGNEKDGRALTLELTRGLAHNVTTEMNLDLWARSQRIRADDVSHRALTEQSTSMLATQYAKRTLPPIAQRELDEFLLHYGMRGVAEIDLGRPRWREDPTPLLNLLKSYLELQDPNAAPDVVFARGAQQAEARVKELAARLNHMLTGRIKARILEAAFVRVRALAGVRESPKFAIIRAFGIYHELLRQCGEELVQKGTLDHPDDVFFLTLEELRQRSVVDLRAQVSSRRGEYNREQLRRRVPLVLTSDGDTFYDVPHAGSANDLIGEPVSPGVVEGEVRVMLDPRGAQLQPGEILVCPATDPAWTPLFLVAGGLIMEVGGLMTHGSVVAREYGIPAVVGVARATERLQSGQHVRVDGSHGFITILDGILAKGSS